MEFAKGTYNNLTATAVLFILTDKSVILVWRCPVPRIVDKQEKAGAIARAALRVFREAGYHRTRMADIAKAAGIGKGTLYEYFENKADILHFLFDAYFAAFKAGALRAIENAASPGARLLALVSFALDHVAEWEDHCAVYVDYFGAARVGDDKFFSLSALYDEFDGLLASLIEQAQASGEIARDVNAIATAELLVSIYDGVVLHGVLTARRSRHEALREAALRLLGQGLVKPRPSATMHANGAGDEG
jgi:AcrR family transcriptional regulator